MLYLSLQRKKSWYLLLLLLASYLFSSVSIVLRSFMMASAVLGAGAAFFLPKRFMARPLPSPKPDGKSNTSGRLALVNSCSIGNKLVFRDDERATQSPPSPLPVLVKDGVAS